MKTFKELIDSLVEITVGTREKKTSAEIMKDKAKYRKDKVKIKARNKKYKKTAGAKKLVDIGKRKEKLGLTATGKKKTVRGGSGSAQRAKELKQKLSKR